MSGTPFVQTPSQTIGPFFHYALPYAAGPDLAAAGVEGERITLEGRVFDGEGAAVQDALIEIWQADAKGRYRHPDDDGTPRNDGFGGFGRTPTDENGRYRFFTIKPGPVPGPNGETQAPHVNLSVFARGVLKRLVTRLYFDDEDRNGADPILSLVPEARRPTLIARRAGDGPAYVFDIVLRGENETVFFDV